jgi:hypothetical protein
MRCASRNVGAPSFTSRALFSLHPTNGHRRTAEALGAEMAESAGMLAPDFGDDALLVSALAIAGQLQVSHMSLLSANLYQASAPVV